MSSPTQRTLKVLRDDGWTAAVVEHWNAYARIRQDLFGILDVLAVKGTLTMGVQCTSDSNVSSRVKKIEQSPVTPALRDAGWSLVVHGWRKAKNGRWQLREVDVS